MALGGGRRYTNLDVRPLLLANRQLDSEPEHAAGARHVHAAGTWQPRKPWHQFPGDTHGRITGWVLGALPPVVAGVLFIISPDHIRLLVDDPLGVQMVLIGLTLQVIGVVAIRRILRVEY